MISIVRGPYGVRYGVACINGHCHAVSCAPRAVEAEVLLALRINPWQRTVQMSQQQMYPAELGIPTD